MREEGNNEVKKEIGFIERKAEELILDEKEREALLKPVLDADYLIQQLLGHKISYMDLCGELINFYPVYYDDTKGYWVWNKDSLKYELKDETDLLNLFYKEFTYSGILLQSIRGQFLTALRMIARQRKPLVQPVNWVQFKDLVVDVVTNKTFKPTPEHFFTNPLPWSLGECEDTPMIDQLLVDWAGEDKNQLLELMAYCLLKDYPIQRIFVLLGSGANGKGSFLRLLRKLLGIGNITSTDLGKLGFSRFESAKLLNKLVCEIAETNVTLLKYTSTLKRLTGGDLINAEYKNKKPFTFENYAKLIIATNSLPMTIDKTEGFYRRWLIIEFNNKFTDGKEITNNIPEEEFNNLGLKLVRVLKELLARGKFTNEGDLVSRMNRYESFSNPLKGFIEANYERDVNSYVKKMDFNDSLRDYLTQRGYRQLTDRETNTGLRSMGHEIKTKRSGPEVFKAIYGLRDKSVTSVTNVTNTPISSSINIEKSIRKVVTTVTPVTIKEWITKILLQYKDDISKRSTASITELLTFNLKVNESEVKEVLTKMSREGLIQEVKHEHWQLL